MARIRPATRIRAGSASVSGGIANTVTGTGALYAQAATVAGSYAEPTTYDDDWAARSTADGVLWAHRFDDQNEVSYFTRGGVSNPSPIPPCGLERVPSGLGAGYAVRGRAIGGTVTAAVAGCARYTVQEISVDNALSFPDPADGVYHCIIGQDIDAIDVTSAGGLEWVEVQERDVENNTITVQRGWDQVSCDVRDVFYPVGGDCFPIPIGFRIGRGPNGSWVRPFGCFPAGQNGKPTADEGITQEHARKTRAWNTNANSYAHWDFREGYFGHKWYWDTATNPSAPYTSWTPYENGQQTLRTIPYEGDEFWLSFRARISATRFLSPTGKMLFIQSPDSSGSAQIFWECEGQASSYGEVRPANETVDGVRYGGMLFPTTCYADGAAPAGGYLTVPQGDTIDNNDSVQKPNYPDCRWDNRPGGQIGTGMYCWCFPAEKWVSYLVHVKLGRDNAPLNPQSYNSEEPNGGGTNAISSVGLEPPWPADSDANFRTTFELFVADEGSNTWKTITTSTDFIWFFGDGKYQAGYYHQNPPNLGAFWAAQDLNNYLGGGSQPPARYPHHIDFTEIILSRSQPAVPYSVSVPGYIAPLAAYESMRLDTVNGGGVTMEDVTPAEWIDSPPLGHSNYSVLDAWSGGAEDRDRKRLWANGAGHDDGANNGLYEYDFTGDDAPKGFTLRKISPVSAIDTTSAAHITNDDGLPGAAHTYDLMCYDYAYDRFMRFGGSIWRIGSFTTACWSYDMYADTWVRLADWPSGVLGGGSVLFDETTRKVLLLCDGSSNGVAFYRVDDDTWSDTKSYSDPIYNCTVARDTTRNRIILIGSNENRLFTPDFSAETLGQSTFSPSGDTEILGSNGISVVYDSKRDSFWMCNPVTQSYIPYLYEMDASTFEITKTAITGDALNVSTGSSGGFHRILFMPEWRALGLITRFDAPAFIVRLPS